MDGGRKKERENRRYENGLRRERERSGEKEYKGWNRVEKGEKRVKDSKRTVLKNFQGRRGK